VPLQSIVATPLAFFLPCKSWYVSAGKLVLLGLGVTTFFLFTSLYYFPGGASQFTDWANALVQGKALDPNIAQRDIAFPLLLVLGGYTVWGSFIGVTLIQAIFAILMPVLVYWSLVRLSPSVAFYSGIVSIASFAQLYFIKWIHHDQTYIFFVILVIAVLANFLQTRKYGFLYGFTLAAVAASFSRPAGNLLFPVLLGAAYLSARGRIVHYLACALIFACAVVLYQWHRYEIFEMRNQASVPSYTGQQIFYNLYINSRAFGVRLSPDEGPNLRQVTEALRVKLQPNVRDSDYIKPLLSDLSAEFLNRYILPFTPDELIEHIYDEPNYEYYLLLASSDPNDQHYLMASWEIASRHPFYVVQFSARNFAHTLYDPGYAHTRRNAVGFHKVGLDFLPRFGAVTGAESLKPRALREVNYDPLPEQQFTVQLVMHHVKLFWDTNFGRFVFWTSILTFIAWGGLLLRLCCLAIPGTPLRRTFASPALGPLFASIVAASIFLVYNDATAAVFAEPDFRYFHFTELLRIIVSAFAVVLLLYLFLASDGKVGAWWRESTLHRFAVKGISMLRDHDFLEQYFSRRPAQWTIALIILTAGSFAWWTLFMIARTW
jgi:hypothetical protein